jgi:hypothetical protein
MRHPVNERVNDHVSRPVRIPSVFPDVRALQNMRSTRFPIVCTPVRIYRGSAAPSSPGKPHLKPEIAKKLLTVREALFRRESVPLSMHVCMENMSIKQHHLWARPCTAAHFCCASTHIGSFDEPKARGGGHRGRAVQAVDPGGDAAWHFRLQAIKDARALRLSADRARPWRAREGGPSPFSTTVLISQKIDDNADVTKRWRA